jgi:hypothetical protein
VARARSDRHSPESKHIESWQLPPQKSPQPPQLFGSLVVSVQPSWQNVKPSVQQAPLLQAVSLGHVNPHAPQLALSVCSLTQVDAQKLSVPGQAQTLPWHCWADGHTLPHSPQLKLSLVRSAHRPPPHDVIPALQPAKPCGPCTP